jgi:hypothetical protein
MWYAKCKKNNLFAVPFAKLMNVVQFARLSSVALDVAPAAVVAASNRYQKSKGAFAPFFYAFTRSGPS